jgi:hypothetical protein
MTDCSTHPWDNIGLVLGAVLSVVGSVFVPQGSSIGVGLGVLALAIGCALLLWYLRCNETRSARKAVGGLLNF